MATLYLDTDVFALARLARLVDQASRDQASGRVLAEIRQLEDRFGLSPVGRRRLQWEMGDSSTSGADEPNTTTASPNVVDMARWERAARDKETQ
jgi:hypothetical protein